MHFCLYGVLGTMGTTTYRRYKNNSVKEILYLSHNISFATYMDIFNLSIMKTKKTSKEHVHFIGIGGIGVSSLARFFLSQDRSVSGSDVSPSDLISELRSDGVSIRIGHAAANIPAGTSLVIHTQAITPDNPELLRARELSIKVQTYPEALGELTRSYRTIAIAGSHGKSTTTALVALMLQKAGLDPTVIIGTKLKEFGGKNFRAGKGPYLVIEADEYKGAFWNYVPEVALITNVDREHLDFYKDLSDVKKSFLRFLGNVTPHGKAFLNKDNVHAASLASRTKAICALYGLDENKRRTKAVQVSMYLPGAHNVSNALGAFSVAKHLGVSDEVILSVLHAYHGSWRRMEYKGLLKHVNAKVFDDYGHHPTEVAATLRAFREAYPKAPLVCVFQPHQTKRLRALFKEFSAAFDACDAVFLLDAYTVSGRDEMPIEGEISPSEQLAVSVAKRKTGPHTVLFIPPSPRMAAVLTKTLAMHISALREAYGFVDDAVVVMMGAGDIAGITPRLLQ